MITQIQNNVAIHRYMEVPTDWNHQTIENCCNILDSKRIPLNSEERRTMMGDIPYYGANGVQGYINKYIFDQDLILLAEDGGYFDEYQTRPIAYYVQGKSWVNNHAHVLTSKEGFDLKWIFYSLVHKNIQPWINGSTRTKLNQSELKKIVIPIPLLKEQRKIATILSTVDELIQKTDQVIEQTQRLKKGLMQKLLTKGIGHTKFKKVRMGFRYMIEEYPEDWKILKLHDFCKIERGKFTHRPRDDPAYYGGSYPFIQTGDVDKSNGYIQNFSQTLNGKGLSVSKLFPNGIIAITIAANIGSVAITTFPVCFRQYSRNIDI